MFLKFYRSNKGWWAGCKSGREQGGGKVGVTRSSVEVTQQLWGLLVICCYQSTQALLQTKVHDLLKGRAINQCQLTLAVTA